MHSLLDKILMIVLGIAVLISGYMTVAHLFFKLEYTSYDSWIFGMNLALLLQMYDNIYNGSHK
jgi:hypothetical protein